MYRTGTGVACSTIALAGTGTCRMAGGPALPLHWQWQAAASLSLRLSDSVATGSASLS